MKQKHVSSGADSSNATPTRSRPSARKIPMDTEDFRKWGVEMVNYIADYMDNLDKRRVVPAIEPGYLR